MDYVVSVTAGKIAEWEERLKIIEFLLSGPYIHAEFDPEGMKSIRAVRYHSMDIVIFEDGDGEYHAVLNQVRAGNADS